MKTWEKSCPNCGLNIDQAADYHICWEWEPGTVPVVPRAVLYWAIVMAVLCLAVGGLLAWCVVNP